MTIYADDRDAALITHDWAFSQRVKRNIIGHHIYLSCDNPDAFEVLEMHIDRVVEMLERSEDLYVSLSKLRMEIYFRSQGWG